MCVSVCAHAVLRGQLPFGDVFGNMGEVMLMRAGASCTGRPQRLHFDWIRRPGGGRAAALRMLRRWHACKRAAHAPILRPLTRRRSICACVSSDWRAEWVSQAAPLREHVCAVCTRALTPASAAPYLHVRSA